MSYGHDLPSAAMGPPRFGLKKGVKGQRSFATPKNGGVHMGQVFYDSWGHDQTNIDFIQVVGITPSGKTALVRSVGKHHIDDQTVEPNGQQSGETYKMRIEVRNDGEPMLRGSLDGRLSSFWKYDKPQYETPAGFGH